MEYDPIFEQAIEGFLADIVPQGRFVHPNKEIEALVNKELQNPENVKLINDELRKAILKRIKNVDL